MHGATPSPVTLPRSQGGQVAGKERHDTDNHALFYDVTRHATTSRTFKQRYYVLSRYCTVYLPQVLHFVERIPRNWRRDAKYIVHSSLLVKKARITIGQEKYSGVQYIVYGSKSFFWGGLAQFRERVRAAR